MMEIDITKDKLLRLRRTFKPVVFENEEGEQIKVKIVNGGFEITRNQDVKVFEKVEE